MKVSAGSLSFVLSALPLSCRTALEISRGFLPFVFHSMSPRREREFLILLLEVRTFFSRRLRCSSVYKAVRHDLLSSSSESRFRETIFSTHRED